MEIIHLVLGKANPERMNGVNKVVSQLATRQVAAGQRASVWGFTRDATENYPERNFATRLFLSGHNPFYLDASFVRALNELDPDRTVFHLHGGWIPLFFRAARVLRAAGLRYVITPHGAYNVLAMQRSRRLKEVYFALCEKYVLRHAAAVHCIGASEVTGLQRLCPDARTVLQPYGMDVTGSPPPPVGAHGDSLVFGFVGRLDYHTKGLDLLLRAFADGFRDRPGASLWLIGDGDGRAAVTELATELGIEDRVVLYGARYGAEKDHLIRQMDVFLHPSRNEGLPSAVLEAAAQGIPSIVTEATNVGEYLREHAAGWVVPNENTELLGRAMLSCATGGRERLRVAGRNAAGMVATRFSWPVIVREFNRLYA